MQRSLSVFAQAVKRMLYIRGVPSLMLVRALTEFCRCFRCPFQVNITIRGTEFSTSWAIISFLRRTVLHIVSHLKMVTILTAPHSSWSGTTDWKRAGFVDRLTSVRAGCSLYRECRVGWPCPWHYWVMALGERLVEALGGSRGWFEGRACRAMDTGINKCCERIHVYRQAGDIWKLVYGGAVLH
jgi:hypothetical protein